MSNKIKLNNRASHGNNVAINNINSTFDMCPAMLIETDINIKIDGPILYMGDDKIDLELYTIGQISEYFTKNNISSKLFSPKLKMHPAIMLADFSNNIHSSFDVYSSPTNISTKIGSTIKNIISINDINIDILSVFNDKQKIEFYVKDNNLYAPVKENTIALSKIKIHKFILYVQKNKIINLDKFVSGRYTPSVKKVLDESNKIVEGI